MTINCWESNPLIPSTWPYLSSVVPGASIDQENVLTDFKEIEYGGQQGIFIPLSEKRSGGASWGSLTAMPGMKKRGYVGFADIDKREAERNYEAYGRLYR